VNRQGFCGSTATALDGSGIARKLADCRQLSGSSTAQKKQKPAEGRALQPVEPGKLIAVAGVSFPDIASGSQAVIFR
jgi:hypothetical protein